MFVTSPQNELFWYARSIILGGLVALVFTLGGYAELAEINFINHQGE